MQREARGCFVSHTSDAAADGDLLTAVFDIGHEYRCIVRVCDISGCIRFLLNLLHKFVLMPVKE
jgi:hypothetical protein